MSYEPLYNSMATSLGEWKLWIKTYQIPLKIDLVSHLANVEGLENTYNNTCYKSIQGFQWGVPRATVANLLDCNIVVSDFKL